MCIRDRLYMLFSYIGIGAFIVAVKRLAPPMLGVLRAELAVLVEHQLLAVFFQKLGDIIYAFVVMKAHGGLSLIHIYFGALLKGTEIKRLRKKEGGVYGLWP